MRAGQLQHLALGDHARGPRQDLEGSHHARLDHQLEGAVEYDQETFEVNRETMLVRPQG